MKTWKIYGVDHTELERIGNYAVVGMSFGKTDTPEYLGLFRVSGKGKYNFISNLRISGGWSSFDDAKEALVSKATTLNEKNKPT